MVVVVDAGRPVTHREDTGELKDACVKAFCLGGWRWGRGRSRVPFDGEAGFGPDLRTGVVRGF